MRTHLLALATVLIVALAGTHQAPQAPAPAATADAEAVRAAVLDYVEGIYNVQPERIERSVHPKLNKVGYWRGGNATEYREAWMTYDQLVNLAATWNKDGHVDAATAPKEIEVFDILDRTAVAKLSADWGVDYMQLARIDGTWKIMNVLWQSYPAE